MADSEKTDEEIALEVQSGKVELFGVLINRYEKKIARYASRLLAKNYDDVQDAVQEVFIKSYVNIQSFDTKRKFSSWLYRIAHNEIVNIIKKNSKKSFLPIFNLDTFFPHYLKEKVNGIEKEVERQEMRKTIELCLSEIESKYKEPIVLYYLEEFSYQEIADIMKLPISTVGVRIRRAKQKMKSILKLKGYKNARA